MSYEGYEIRYCKKGHRGPIFDSYMVPIDNPSCELCGSPMELIDPVDLTNGCVCEELGRSQCPAHPKELKIENYEYAHCSYCKQGFIKINRLFKTIRCKCLGQNRVCTECYGVGYIPIPDEASEIEFACRRCNGIGRIRVPVFDVRRLIRERIEGDFK